MCLSRRSQCWLERAFAALAERRNDELLGVRSAGSCHDASDALGTIRLWAWRGTTIQNQEFYKDRRLVSDQELQAARVEMRVALMRLQDLRPDPVLDGERDILDELLFAAVQGPATTGLMCRIESLGDRMDRRIDELFPQVSAGLITMAWNLRRTARCGMTKILQALVPPDRIRSVPALPGRRELTDICSAPMATG
jgi:hypothetical protein